MLPLFDEQKNAPTPPFDVEAAFEAFWADWPRKSGKKKARHKFYAALIRVPLSTLTNALGWQRHLAQWKKTDAQGVHIYVPHLATWLHQERYNDPMPPGFRMPKTVEKNISTVTPEQAQRLLAIRAHIDHQNHLGAIETGEAYYRSHPWVKRAPIQPCPCANCVKARES